MKMMGPTHSSVILYSKTIEQEPCVMKFLYVAVGLKENRWTYATNALMDLSYKMMITYLLHGAESCLRS